MSKKDTFNFDDFSNELSKFEEEALSENFEGTGFNDLFSRSDSETRNESGAFSRCGSDSCPGNDDDNDCGGNGNLTNRDWYRKGLRDGMARGFRCGFQAGKERGLERGFKEGFSRGTENLEREVRCAYERGFREGCREGFKKGFKQGCREGFRQGYRQGYENAFRDIMRCARNINSGCN